MSDVEQGVPVCPECGKELEEGAVACECGHVFFNDDVEDTSEIPAPPEPADTEAEPDPLADWAGSDDIEDGPWEEMSDEDGSVVDSEEHHQASMGKAVILIIVVLVNLGVLAGIFYLVFNKKPRANGSTIVEETIVRPGSRTDPATALITYTTQPGTPARAIEDAIVNRRLNCPIKEVALDGGTLTVTLKKEAVWDMAQLREHAEADALKILQGALAATDAKVTTLGVRLEARMGGDTGTEWETAFQLECSREKAANIAKMTDARSAAMAAGAKLHKRLIEGE